MKLNKLMPNSLSMVSITKRFFYLLFKAAFATAFTQNNIESAFAKTGILPFDLEQVSCENSET
jgi:hypothetical protein